MKQIRIESTYSRLGLKIGFGGSPMDDILASTLQIIIWHTVAPENGGPMGTDLPAKSIESTLGRVVR